MEKNFKERHRVNGRALKYVEDDLPKRIVVESSLLFADRSKRRLLGLPSPKRPTMPDVPTRTVPFISPRTKRKQGLKASGISFDPLSVSCHENAQRSGTARRNKISFDPLSVSCHENAQGGGTNGRKKMSFNSLSVSCHDQGSGAAGRKKMISFDPLSVSCHESSDISRPTTVRRGKRSAVDINAKRAFLEQFIASKSMR